MQKISWAPYRLMSFACTEKDCADIGVLLNHLSSANTRAPVVQRPTPTLEWMRCVTEEARLYIVYDKLSCSIVGMATLHDEFKIEGYCGVVHEVSVHPLFAKRGIATALMRHIHERGRELRMRQIKLTSSKPNARRLYESIGYRYKDEASKQMYFDLEIS